MADTAVAADRGVPPGANDVVADEPGTILDDVARELAAVDVVAWVVVDGTDPLDEAIEQELSCLHKSVLSKLNSAEMSAKNTLILHMRTSLAHFVRPAPCC